MTGIFSFKGSWFLPHNCSTNGLGIPGGFVPTRLRLSWCWGGGHLPILHWLAFWVTLPRGGLGTGWLPCHLPWWPSCLPAAPGCPRAPGGLPSEGAWAPAPLSLPPSRWALPPHAPPRPQFRLRSGLPLPLLSLSRGRKRSQSFLLCPALQLARAGDSPEPGVRPVQQEASPATCRVQGCLARGCCAGWLLQMPCAPPSIFKDLT